MNDLKPASQRVVEAAAKAGLAVEIVTFPAGTRTAADAAAAIGCDVGAIAKSIVLHDDDGPLLVFTSGRNRVDLDAVGSVLGTPGVRRADAEEARAATGYVIGGTAPFGHPRPLRMLADRSLADHELLWASGGTPDTVFSLTFDQLVGATGAIVSDVARDGGGAM